MTFLTSAAKTSSDPETGEDSQRKPSKRPNSYERMELSSKESMHKKRKKALEAPKGPRRPKTHWDHVLEEMVWLSKDFESERKWKLAQARKVALKASKGMVDHATREEKKSKEEENRIRKVALSISKDVKKFWVKIEKLVLYKHQKEMDVKKKKALDRQLEFLLGQTERYSTMLAENLVDKPALQYPVMDQATVTDGEYRNGTKEPVELHEASQPRSGVCESDCESDDDYDIRSEESEDDERTIEQDEALITEDERREELAALHNEVDIPIDELLKRYATGTVSGENTLEMSQSGPESAVNELDHAESEEKTMSATIDSGMSIIPFNTGRRCNGVNGDLPVENHLLEIETAETIDQNNIPDEPSKDHVLYDFNEEQEDEDFVLATGEEKDDETTLAEEEEFAKADPKNPTDEISLLQKESEIPIEELLARYKKDFKYEVSEGESEYTSSSDNEPDSLNDKDNELKQLDIVMDANADTGESLQVSLDPAQAASSEKIVEDENESEDRIADAAAAARSAQPTGNTFSTTKVRTKFPFLIKYPLREYQHIGLDWLVTMYEKRLNGILADEMGLGKTIMTIALLAHLACEKGIWGPHLIVVPTSVMLNWETEFLKWCPAFKILTYFGSAKERKSKRQGWMKPNSFHICITTYRLVIQDSKVFKRKKWKYLILDEAHLIKNWKSQRWQTLLNFNSKRRILLTGTPLQNDLMELWSLMHFLMPHIFQSHQEFKDWFCNPISGMVEGQEKVNKEVVDRLHNVLRPFLLRRLKRDVEKQLPMKHEHVIFCRLSKRQRNLYEDFIASSETQATLASSNFFGMISIIMQLRKVCNHPDLFEGRPIVSSFDMDGIDIQLSSDICSMLMRDPFSTLNLVDLGLLFTCHDFNMTSWEFEEVNALATPMLTKDRTLLDYAEELGPQYVQWKLPETNIFEEIRRAVAEERLRDLQGRAESIAWWNSLRCRKKPTYSTSLRELLTIKSSVDDIYRHKVHQISYIYSSKLAEAIITPVERFERMIDVIESFMFAIPAARAPVPNCWCNKRGTTAFLHPTYKEKCSEIFLPLLSPLRPAIVRRQVYFPDKRLIQFDCGKLQELAVLLRKLKSGGHRALIFTQMTKMLDILEAFINLYGYTYMRLDGSTQPEERQTLMQRFNTNPKIFLFILSTRSGGVGINLFGADTVIFYDSDWNPAMDQQAQDRCHRIGQTREVHIYRLISDSTIEENILKKANQKRALDDLVIQSGSYNTEFFKKLDPIELFSGHKALPIKNVQKEKIYSHGDDISLSNADVEAALKHAEDEADYMALKKVEQEEAVDNQEFTEAIGRLEDDELVNDDDTKADESADLEITTLNNDNAANLSVKDNIEQRTVAFAANDDDVDMMADAKQMAAAAAASGQEMSTFEKTLRPIDRYAIRFLELWDPIIDKAAMESEMRFEQEEWELDRIEKYKEEMEAEIDDDEEPMIYERWDADFATEAYRQQVEILAKNQLMEELEAEAKEEDADDNIYDTDNTPRKTKSKSKKKPKKAKFKSLKKGSLTSDFKHVKEEPSIETMSMDDDVCYNEEVANSEITSQLKKRKKVETLDIESGKSSKKKSKKLNKTAETCLSDLDSNLSGKQPDDLAGLKSCENVATDLELKPSGRSKNGGKISITAMTVKRILTIKPEKLKKGNVWSRDCVPFPDSWLPQEDAILCAVVHEYGPHWTLVSETLYGMTAGGFYRGRYRHPVHCCERFRELFQRYVLSAPENPVNEKTSTAGSVKGVLKVTEDNIQMLLTVMSESPDNELLLQRHFVALLSSVWRTTPRVNIRQNGHNLSPSITGLNFGVGRLLNSFNRSSWSSVKEPAKRMKFTNLAQSSKLLAFALREVSGRPMDDTASISSRMEDAHVPELLEVTLEFEKEDGDSFPLPPVIDLSIPISDSISFVNKDLGGKNHIRASESVAESRFRESARACGEGSREWALTTFPANDIKLRTATKQQLLGKHKLTASESTKPPRSKLKKTSEHGDVPQMLEPLFQSQPAVSYKDPGLKFDFELTPAFILDGLINDTDDCYSLSYFDKATSAEMGCLEDVSHSYDADLISGLDNCSSWPELTDIG